MKRKAKKKRMLAFFLSFSPMIICIEYFVIESKAYWKWKKKSENFTFIMPIVRFLRNYFDIDFTDYGVSSYDIGTGFGHFAIATQDVSLILYSWMNVDVISVLVLRLNCASLEHLGLQIGWRRPGQAWRGH